MRRWIGAFGLLLIGLSGSLALADRLPIPDAAAVKSAEQLVNEVFGDDLHHATTPEQQLALANRMIDTARKTKGNPSQRYVLFKMAGDLALAAGDAASADTANQALSEEFDVDPVSMQMERFDTAVKSARSAADFSRWARTIGSWIAAKEMDLPPDQARRADELAAACAKKSGDAALIARAAERLSNLASREAAYALAKSSIAALEKDPNDPAANLAVGKYTCFTLGEWEKGLAMLARGSDARLKDLATREISPAAEALALGDAWWDIAGEQRPPAQQQIRLHAAAWYQVAQATAAGLQKTKIDRRIASVEALPGGKERLAQAHPGGRIAHGKLLIIMPKDETQVAVTACEKYGLPYDLAKSFDAARDNYHDYSTIVCGSNAMMYWKQHKTPEDFQYINAFIENGGHLVVFGSYNSDGDFQLKPYGIITSYYHGDHFAAVPGATELLMSGNESLLPTDTFLHTAGNFKCISPHVVLLARVKKTGEPDGPLMITMPWKKGRITFNLVEPNWKQPHDALWLITATLSWISRGSPMGTVQ